MLRSLVVASFLLAIAGLVRAESPSTRPAEKETFGAESNPSGAPIGGGKDYDRWVDRPERRVDTAEALLAALERARPGHVVYVDDHAEIDLSGQHGITIPAGVTLASGRGRDGSAGALLFSNELDTQPLFTTGGPKVRVTGLRLRGPDPERRTEQMRQLHREGKYYSLPNSDGIDCTHPDLEVDNCELSGWSHAAVFLKEGAKAHVHHNHIHHNQRQGLGYGICLDKGVALIEANLFDWCRHHIAATGRPGTSYEARYNLVLEHGNGHSFDMHGGADRKDGTNIAGDWIRIHHNTFKAVDVRAIGIRGRPRELADIHHNWFLHADAAKAVFQSDARENMKVHRNQFGPARTLGE